MSYSRVVIEILDKFLTNMFMSWFNALFNGLSIELANELLMSC